METDFKPVRLITGTYMEYGNIVGYCTCDTHRGYLSKVLLRNHKCIEKGCPFLTKHNEEYWGQRTYREQKRINEKTQNKQKKAIKKEQNQQEQEFLNYCKMTAQRLASELGFDMIITRVSRNNDNKLNCDYIIHYVSNRKFDDFKLYFSLAKCLSKSFKKTFRFRRIRTLTGELAMKSHIYK